MNHYDMLLEFETRHKEELRDGLHHRWTFRRRVASHFQREEDGVEGN